MSDNSVKFSINVTGENTGEKWAGVFTTKLRLSHRDQLRMDQIRRDLLGPNAATASPRAQNQADVFSEIAIHIVDAPQWWKMQGDGLDLEDDNVISTIYGEIMKAKTEARKKFDDEATAAKAELEKVK